MFPRTPFSFHLPFDSKINRARDPYIGISALKRMSFSPDPLVKFEVSRNLSERLLEIGSSDNIAKFDPEVAARAIASSAGLELLSCTESIGSVETWLAPYVLGIKDQIVLRTLSSTGNKYLLSLLNENPFLSKELETSIGKRLSSRDHTVTDTPTHPENAPAPDPMRTAAELEEQGKLKEAISVYEEVLSAPGARKHFIRGRIKELSEKLEISTFDLDIDRLIKSGALNEADALCSATLKDISKRSFRGHILSRREDIAKRALLAELESKFREQTAKEDHAGAISTYRNIEKIGLPSDVLKNNHIQRLVALNDLSEHTRLAEKEAHEGRLVNAIHIYNGLLSNNYCDKDAVSKRINSLKAALSTEYHKAVRHHHYHEALNMLEHMEEFSVSPYLMDISAEKAKLQQALKVKDLRTRLDAVRSKDPVKAALILSEISKQPGVDVIVVQEELSSLISAEEKAGHGLLRDHDYPGYIIKLMTVEHMKQSAPDNRLPMLLELAKEIEVTDNHSAWREKMTRMRAISKDNYPALERELNYHIYAFDVARRLISAYKSLNGTLAIELMDLCSKAKEAGLDDRIKDSIKNDFNSFSRGSVSNVVAGMLDDFAVASDIYYSLSNALSAKDHKTAAFEYYRYINDPDLTALFMGTEVFDALLPKDKGLILISYARLLEAKAKIGEAHEFTLEQRVASRIADAITIKFESLEYDMTSAFIASGRIDQKERMEEERRKNHLASETKNRMKAYINRYGRHKVRNTENHYDVIAQRYNEAVEDSLSSILFILSGLGRFIPQDITEALNVEMRDFMGTMKLRLR